jgi:hypothetical protein
MNGTIEQVVMALAEGQSVSFDLLQHSDFQSILSRTENNPHI